MSKILGSCLCGKVRFESSNNFENFHLCHCTQCQKATGSAFASNLFTSPENINWVNGLEFIKRYDVPNRSISKAFCTECGSGVPYLSGSGQSMVVPAGCLDNEPVLEPQDNIFCSEQVKWYKKGVSAKRFETFPE